MANPTVTPIMTPATGPSNPFAGPVYLVDQFGNPLSSTNPQPVAQASDYPAGAIPITATSGNQANAVATATLAAAAGKTTYITGFEVTGTGATGVLIVIATVTNTVSGTMSYTYVFVAGVTTANTPLSIQFTKAIPANAPNTTIVVSCPASGLGGTNNVVNAHGYQL